MLQSKPFIITALYFFFVQLLLVAAKERENTFLNRQRCFVEFAFAGFKIFDYDSYPEFFTEDSVMELAQAGRYYGPAGIEEYVRFADSSSPYVKDYLDLDQNAVVKTASDPVTGECVMLVNAVVNYELDETTAFQQTHSVGFQFKIFYEPKGFVSGVIISRINVFFDQRFLDDFFGRLTNTEQTRLTICEIMDSKCPETWALNELESMSDCEDRLFALPIAADNGDATGNNQACRVVHAVIASLNDFHCAHISFAPQEDPNGVVKCQENVGVLSATLFDESDLNIFYNRMEAVGFEDRLPYFICDCDNLSSRENVFRFFRFRNVWDFVNGINPFPPIWLPLKGKQPIPKCSLCVYK